MNYQNAKVYFDGSHYIAIPKGTFPSKGKKKHKSKSKKSAKQEMFEKAYRESLSKPKKEQVYAIEKELQKEFKSQEELNAFVSANIERERKNAIKRKVRLMRKIRLQTWNYFCTFTYDDKLHTEQSFRKKLSNTLKHLVYRNGWKYIGVWERSPEKQRLHFHGIFYIPKMIGTIEEVTDYSTTNQRKQTTYQNSHFLKHFGRNDFKEICVDSDITQAVKYITKYLEKSGEKLIFGGKLPTYFVSDILDDDIVCPYGVDDRKALLFDNFNCITDGEIIGQVSRDTIAKMPKHN